MLWDPAQGHLQSQVSLLWLRSQTQRAASDGRGDHLLMLLLRCSLLSSLQVFRHRPEQRAKSWDTQCPCMTRLLTHAPRPGASVRLQAQGEFLGHQTAPLSHRHVQGGTQGLFMSIHRAGEQLFLLAGLTGRSVELNLLHSLCRGAH